MLSAQPARARRFRGRSPGFNASGTSAGAVIPFDHAATFELRGIPGNIVQDVINVSTDGTFVAVAIGYGFEQDRALEVPLGAPQAGQANTVGAIRLAQVPTISLLEGFRLNPQLSRVAFDLSPPLSGGRPSPQREPVLSNNAIVTTFSSSIIEHIKPAEDISFLFSIVDSATGRELQDEPINNLASLGSSDGVRPFRMLAQPLTFQPRSSVRLQVVERSEGLTGTLFIVLYGYKILGANREDSVRTVPLNYPGQANGGGSNRIIPFDYVSKFLLTGEPGNLIEDEVPINTEGGFVATSIGYGLSVQNLGVTLSNLNESSNDLADLTLSQFPTSALQDGIRIRPNSVRIAFQNDGTLRPGVPASFVNQIFERLNRPESVSFRYSIADTGTGRDLQNQPINNVAGLGIATGERPFKRLARPMSFLPRSTVRVTVEEGFGRGMLFIVFQGYKVLTAAPAIQAATMRGRSRRR